MTQHLGGRDRISINSVSQGHMLQNPILKKKIRPTLTTKIGKSEEKVNKRPVPHVV